MARRQRRANRSTLSKLNDQTIAAVITAIKLSQSTGLSDSETALNALFAFAETASLNDWDLLCDVGQQH